MFSEIEEIGNINGTEKKSKNELPISLEDNEYNRVSWQTHEIRGTNKSRSKTLRTTETYKRKRSEKEPLNSANSSPTGQEEVCLNNSKS